ncbi:MAG: hypothetical protein RIR51_670 [Bacteroidota bacterium]|jgi:1-deoxy-D-xylulose-5-phosphate reductoisomerase
MRKRIAILGSTGSIGTQALEVVRNHSDKFEISVITAQNSSELLIAQAKEFLPKAVVIINEEKFSIVKSSLADLDIEVFAGKEALEQVVVREDVDIVLTALVGYAGLLPTIKAINAGKDIALANKETLVVAGGLIMPLIQEKGVKLLPVDSEHSAIFQCMVGEKETEVEKIILTASGGPFRGYSKEQLGKVTKAQALKHPNWEMGAKITIDSASLMNKGLEVIEAAWLFNLKAEEIDVVVHPQSIIHSMVQFKDGSIKAQMGLPDMKLPIQYALAFPERIDSDFPRYDFQSINTLTFEKPDKSVFGNLALAYKSLELGGNSACLLNAANEIAVEAFLKEEIQFLDIAKINEFCMKNGTFIKNPLLEDYISSDLESRKIAKEYIQKLN